MTVLNLLGRWANPENSLITFVFYKREDLNETIKVLQQNDAWHLRETYNEAMKTIGIPYERLCWREKRKAWNKTFFNRKVERFQIIKTSEKIDLFIHLVSKENQNKESKNER